MANDTTRLTLYAIISAYESDMRDQIVNHITPVLGPTETFQPKILSRITERFEKENSTGKSSYSISDLVTYLDFDEASQVIFSHRDRLPDDLSTILREHAAAIQILPSIRNRVMHGRPLELDDFARTIDIARSLVAPSDLYFHNTRTTLDRLRSTPEYVFSLAFPIPKQESTCHNLPYPDFDETGFIGRRTDEEKLLKLVLGAHPVISIVAEGGMGKSALAIKVAYTVLDLKERPFDAVIWTTAKTSQLTASEIREIDDAISTSVGLLGTACKALGSDETDPFAAIIEYMSNFKILLIIDNLETVTDGKIKDFLDRLPIGNKVLITSRIGLGEFERRLILDPLKENDAARLLNALARSRSINAITSRSQDAIASYCRRMRNNPGFVKWFVSAVQSGKRPEDVLCNTAIFLEYCLSNVYEYLDTTAQSILQVMLAVPRPLGLPEIQIISNLTVDDLQRGLYRLSSTNMTKMSGAGTSAGSETCFSLTDIARDYLNKHHPIGPATANRYRNAYNRLASNSAFTDQESKSNRYSFFSIVRRNRTEAIIASNLTEALRAIKEKQMDKAFKIIETARALAPQFFEVHRVNAWAYVVAQDYPQADNSYQTSIELEPNWAPLRLWYGNFLARCMRDNERALTQFDLAARIEPNEPTITLERARSLMYIFDFAKSKETLSVVIQSTAKHPQIARKAFDLNLQIDVREGSHAIQQKDHIRAHEVATRFVDNISLLDHTHVDRFLCETLRRGYEFLERLFKRATGDSRVSDAEITMANFRNQLIRLRLSSFAAEIGDAQYGIVKTVKEPGYGFITTDSGDDFYFILSSVRGVYLDSSSLTGRSVRFYKGANSMGICATRVVLLTDDVNDVETFDEYED